MSRITIPRRSFALGGLAAACMPVTSIARALAAPDRVSTVVLSRSRLELTYWGAPSPTVERTLSKLMAGYDVGAIEIGEPEPFRRRTMVLFSDSQDAAVLDSIASAARMERIRGNVDHVIGIICSGPRPIDPESSRRIRGYCDLVVAIPTASVSRRTREERMVLAAEAFLDNLFILGMMGWEPDDLLQTAPECDAFRLGVATSRIGQRDPDDKDAAVDAVERALQQLTAQGCDPRRLRIVHMTTVIGPDVRSSTAVHAMKWLENRLGDHTNLVFSLPVEAQRSGSMVVKLLGANDIIPAP